MHNNLSITRKNRSVLSLLLFGWACLIASLPGAAQARSDVRQAATPLPGRYNPVGDAHAMVTIGKARFTVLAPQLIRMEWAADGKFEDHASLVFLNRHLPVPRFTVSEDGGKHSIKTDALSLLY